MPTPSSADARDELLHDLVDFLRGALPLGNLRSRLDALSTHSDPTVRAAASELESMLPDRGGVGHPADAATIGYCLRLAAALAWRHDLHLVRVATSDGRSRLGLAGLLVLGALFAVMPWYGPWPLLGAWALLGALLFAIGARGTHPAIAALAQCRPYATDADWQAHASVLDELGLPQPPPVLNEIAPRAIGGFGWLLLHSLGLPIALITEAAAGSTWVLLVKSPRVLRLPGSQEQPA